MIIAYIIIALAIGYVVGLRRGVNVPKTFWKQYNYCPSCRRFSEEAMKHLRLMAALDPDMSPTEVKKNFLAKFHDARHEEKS